MRKTKTITQEAPSTQELADKEKARAAAYARMTANDYVEVPHLPARKVAIASNGRPCDPITGRYTDR
jgi:hypothetical protein